jgi:hypothetical protein
MKFTINKKRFPDLVVFISCFIIILVVALNLNFPGGKLKMGGEIWSDKAFYYVYLPATFIYHFDASKFPEGIESETGYGISLDLQNNKVLIKTTCGVSILVAPFFLVAHLAATVFDLRPDGFSMIYQQMAVVAGVFYLILGLFFLKKVLDNYFRSWITYVTLLFLLAGTNLYFYGLDDVLMSHVYSFFLISLFLYLLKMFYDEQKRKYVHFFLLGLVASMLVLIRPTNVIILFIALFFDARSFKDAWNRILLFLKPRYLVTLVVTGFIVFLPQLIYWKYIFGSFLYYSYVGEGFSNWLQPRIIEIWFSPLNGLFLYNPILVFMIAGMLMMIIKRIPNGIFILGFFLFISYLFSSWGVWYFGGAHGSRPFVDFYPLLCIPFGYFIDSVYSLKKMIVKIIFTAFMVLFSFYNIKLIYNYQCFTGSTWGWDDFILTLDRAGLYNLERNTYTYMNDFENITFNDGVTKTWEAPHSYSRSTFMVEDIFYNCSYYRKTDDIIRHKAIKTVSLSFWIRPKDCDKTGSYAVFKIIGAEEKTLCSKLIRVDDFPTLNNHYTEVTGIFEVPDSISHGNVFGFYIWNKNQQKFFIDDLKMVFDSRANKK